MKVVMIPGLEAALAVFAAEARKDLDSRLAAAEAKISALDARVKELEKKS